MIFAGKWMEREKIILYELTQTHKGKYVYIHLFVHISCSW